MAEILGPGQAQPTDDQLLEKLKPQVDVLTNQYIMGDVDREKVVQYANVRRNHLYWEGKQFLYPTIINGQVVDFSAVSGSILSTQAGGADITRSYDYVINHFRGDGRKFIAVLGQRAPNVKAQPDRPTDDSAIRLSRQADDLAGLLRSHWDVEYVQRAMALSLWKNGTTFLYTPYISNGDQYGWTEEPQIDLVDGPIGEPMAQCLACGHEEPMAEGQDPQNPPTCPDCGSQMVVNQPPMGQVPQQTGTQKYPNGSVELHMASVLEVTTPFYVKDLANTPWLWYEYDEHKANLLRAFPKLKDLMKNDATAERQMTSSNMGRITRDIASGPNSLLFARGNRWLFQRFWMRPSMFGLLDDQSDQNGELKQLLETNFPKGIKATYVGGKLVQLESESIDEVWTMVKPETSEYIFANPIGEDYLGPQDVINDAANITIEWMERAIPLTVVDPQVFDIEALRKWAATPMEFLPAKPNAGGSIKDAMTVMPVAKVDADIGKFAEGIKDEARQIVGILPAIFGGDTGTQTAREAELKRNQSMMQLGTTWNEMRKGWVRAYENGALQLAKHAGDRVHMLMGGQQPTTFEMADLGELANGGWHYEAEEAMPMTWGQERDVIWDMVGKGPPVWQLFGLQDPNNLPMIQRSLGMRGYTIPGLNMHDHIMDLIQQLLQGQPQLTQDPMSGATVALPSQPIDVSGVTEDHQMVVKLGSDWATGEEGQRAKASNEEGYQNVLAWVRKHLEQLGPPPGSPAPQLQHPGGNPAPPPPAGGPPRPAQPGGGPPAPAPGGPSGAPAPPAINQPVPRSNQPPLPAPPPPSPLARPGGALPTPMPR